MINDEELGQWISEFHPTVETEIIEVLRARVQYAILDPHTPTTNINNLRRMYSSWIWFPNSTNKLDITSFSIRYNEYKSSINKTKNTCNKNYLRTLCLSS